MLETNEIAPGALNEDVLSARNAIAQLTEKGLDLSKISIEQLNSILFSDNPNEALRGVVANMPEEKKGELLKMEAEKIVNNGIPVNSFSEELDDDNPEKSKWNQTYEVVKWDNNALQLALNGLSDILNSESCSLSDEKKTDFITRLIAKVANDIDSERHKIKHGEHAPYLLSDRDDAHDLIRYNFADIAIKTFPSLELTKEKILNSCEKHYECGNY